MNLTANHLETGRSHDFPTHPDDWFLAQQCVAGDSGAQRQLRAVLDSFVKGCLRNRGASYTDAEDIVADIASEIPAAMEKDFCLLRKYKGKCSLKNWLSRVAINRWIDLKRREIFVVQLPSGKSEDSPSPIERIPSQEAGVPEDFLLTLLRTCLRPAFGACTAEQLLMLRLVYLENLSQREVGMMWGWHRSKVNRALRATMRGIESRTLSQLSVIDPWLAVSWDDFLNMYAVSALQFF